MRRVIRHRPPQIATFPTAGLVNPAFFTDNRERITLTYEVHYSLGRGFCLCRRVDFRTEWFGRGSRWGDTAKWYRDPAILLQDAGVTENRLTMVVHA